jgi:LacI family transcriptional regulator
MARAYEVAVILNLNKDYDRKVAASISSYAHTAGNWRIYLEDELANRMPAFHHWRGHGVIADIDDERVLRRVSRLTVPVVGIGGTPIDLAPPEMSYVYTDNVRIGELAAEHLLERGLRHFAYCGIPYSYYNAFAHEREQAFCGRLRAAGFDCPVFHGRYRYTTNWDALLDALAGWLKTLMRPVGLMACDDPRARHVLLACRRAGLAVPEDVAVVSVDNDPLMCEMVDPTLTSVQQGTERIGYEAAALLDRMMRRRRQVRRVVKVPPIGVVVRGSTNIALVDDDAVAKALRFIQDHVSEAVQTAAVARHVGLSRGMLDIRFCRAIGRSVYAEISRVRQDTVRKLLLTTDLPLKVIASRTGFRNVEYLVTTFRRWSGQTPGEYRKTNQR